MASTSQITMTELSWDELSSFDFDTSISDTSRMSTGSFKSTINYSDNIKYKRTNQFDNPEKRISYADSNSLCEDLRQITDFPDLCDVMFLVGPSEVPVHGVRSLISARSRYFFQLILAAQKNIDLRTKSPNKKLSVFKKIKCLIGGKQSQIDQNTATQRTAILTIKLKDCNSVTFHDVISYLHSGRLEISPDKCIDLLRMAAEFRLLHLQEVCLNFVCQSRIQRSAVSSHQSCMK